MDGRCLLSICWKFCHKFSYFNAWTSMCNIKEKTRDRNECEKWQNITSCGGDMAVYDCHWSHVVVDLLRLSLWLSLKALEGFSCGGQLVEFKRYNVLLILMEVCHILKACFIKVQCQKLVHFQYLSIVH